MAASSSDTVRFDASAFRRFAALTRRWSVTMPEHLAAVAAPASVELLKASQDAINKRTGKTARDLKVRMSHGMGIVRLEMTGDKVAQMLITGTKPHIIRPRHGRALSFYWAKVGHNVVLSSVRHPGTKPNDWRKKAMTRARPKLIALGLGSLRLMAAEMKAEASGL